MGVKREAIGRRDIYEAAIAIHAANISKDDESPIGNFATAREWALEEAKAMFRLVRDQAAGAGTNHEED